MSTPTPPRLALVCRLTRIRAVLTGPDSSSVQRHGATCVECRPYFAHAAQWESGLRREAKAVAADPPGTLESRILHAVELSRLPERRSSRSLSWTMAGLAAACVAAVVMVRMQRPAPAETPAQMASVDDVLAVASQLPRQWRAIVEPGATKLLHENLLQTEMASVSSDARLALSFLALNFFPAKVGATPASEPPSRQRSSS